jgi:hypothetical protein
LISFKTARAPAASPAARRCESRRVAATGRPWLATVTGIASQLSRKTTVPYTDTSTKRSTRMTLT